jgi:Tol biopolymer transport system component/predicted Ser/Thr protein kinase
MDSDSTQFLHYEIERQLGKGGMGEVFLARDTRLKRQVALKFLSEGVRADPATMERFEREAQAAAALNDPSIVTIYEIGEDQGQRYIAMEYVEGMSLREMLVAGPLPVEEVLEITQQLTEGLQKAHEHGIIHRDIKPENILVTDDGHAKLLDFGIAKLKGLRNLTQESRTVGTVRYMAPEQIKGEHLDLRADVWALGVVIYEMLTAHSPFKGEYDSTLMYSILCEEPEPLATYRSDVPAELDAIVRRALEKEPGDRFPDMGALRSAIDRLRRPPTLGARAGGRLRVVPSWLWWAGGGGAVLLAGWVLSLLFGTPDTHLARPVTLQQVTYLGDVSGFDMAPDGTTAAYVSSGFSSSSALHVLDLAGGSSIEVLAALRLGLPSWSPEGRSLAISAVLDDSTSGTFLVPRLGGNPRRLSPALALRCSWSPAGERIALYDGVRLLLVQSASGEAQTLGLPDSLPLLRSLEWSPDGRWLLGSSIGDRFSSLWLVDVSDGSVTSFARETFTGGTVLTSPRWSPDGATVYCLRRGIQTGDGELLAFSLGPKGQATGAARVAAFGLQDVTEIDLSADGGRLLATREITKANLWLALRDAQGMVPHRLTRGTAWRSRASLSPDGRQVAFTMKDVEGFNLYLMPLVLRNGGAEAGQPAKITSLRTFSFAPVWSPDGRAIAFGSAESGTLRIWRIAPDGGELRRFEKTRLDPVARSLQWAPGNEIIYAGAEGRRLRRLDPASGRSEPLVLSDTLSAMDAPVWSPDGSRIAVRVSRGHEDSLTGVWIASPERLLRHLTQGWEFVPVGWAEDGGRVFLMKGSRPEVYAVGVRGGTPVQVSTLPFESPDWTGLSMGANGDRVLYTRFSDRRDLWLVEPLEGQGRHW